MSEHLKWLEKIQEKTLEPDLLICDPHHHLWNYPKSRYLLDEILEDTNSGHNIVSTVFVECMSEYRNDLSNALAPVGETEFVQKIADENKQAKTNTKIAAGIVSYADLLLGNSVTEILEAHIEASPNRFKGIRHACGWDESDLVRNSHSNPPRSLYLNEVFRKGFATLSNYDLTFDAWLYHTQHEELISLAHAFPNQTIILNHVGGPLGIGPYKGKREEIFHSWMNTISKLAECENVVVKLGGLAMAINGFEWHKKRKPPSSEELAKATAPYLVHCIEKFTPQRCMFESNFPVDKVSCSYNILWNSFKRITKSFSQQEKYSLFYGTASKTYNLSESSN